jgi:Arc/MetJ-type ribon-helix-helix transcriptional regulator
MAKTVVIAVRVPKEIKNEIEELGLEVPEFVREAVEEKLKKIKSEEALKWVTANRVQGKEIGFNSTTIIRQMRETT